MTQRYFEKLPNLFYNNYLVKDISRRSVLIEDPRQSPYVFYPYEIQHNLRSDQIADYYYNDPEMDWMIYLTNGIVDPYYGWYLNNDQFETMIIDKYQSIEIAQRKIAFFRNNWATDDSELTVSFYNNTLLPEWKKYYSPNWGPNTRILSYSRKKDDSVMNTNRILDYQISANNNPNSMTIGELVNIKIAGQDAVVGLAEVVATNTTVIRVQSVDGNTSANSTHNKQLIGVSSSANLTVNSVNTSFINISTEEQVFWSAVTYYQYEQELNEQYKHIRLVDSGASDLLIQQFQRSLNENVDEVTNLTLENND